MPIYQRKSGVWYIDIRTPSGSRIRQSTGTQNKQEAQRLHDKLKYEQWLTHKIGETPEHTWEEAAVRWIHEKGGEKKSIQDDLSRLRGLTVAFKGKTLAELNRDCITTAIAAFPCSNSTKNRYIALIRAILRKAEFEWHWLDKAPKLSLYREPKRRIRWLTPAEAQKLIAALPDYMAEMAIFSLATGLRQRNVFTHSQGRRLHSISSRIWRNALETAGISDFRWHDLRHTWASWLVQSGVPLAALQEMGGWESIKMVQKYAHLSPEHLQQHAAILDGFSFGKDTNWTHEPNHETRKKSLNNCLG